MLLSVRPGFNLGRAFFARSMAAFSHPRGQHLVQELSQPAVRRVVLVPRMPILPDLKCFHKNWRPHGPESVDLRSEEHTSELQSLMRISYAVFCLKKKKYSTKHRITTSYIK